MDIVAMKENMEKMQLAFCKAQGMDDCLYNMSGLSSKTLIALPPKFKIFDAKMFNGTGDPKQHVMRYISITEMKGLDEKQTIHAFHLSLMGGASKWYYSLDQSKTKDWNELVELFVDQFIFNTMIDVNLRDLETIKHGVKETFFEYMTRWKGKASKMVNRPNEKDQTNMIIKNLLPAYNSRLLSWPISSLESCVIVGLELKLPSIMDNWIKGGASLQSRRHIGEGQQPLKHPIP